MEDPPQEKLNAIIDRAFDLEGAALAAYLDKTCASNAQLRQKVEACLAGADVSVPKGFISDPVPGVNVAALNLVALKEEADFNNNQFENGDTVGVYRILEMLGEGGMGEVYLAERNDNQFHRKVAIKIVKAGMGTQEVLARFHYERQILANLKHSNIAQLLYGDVTDTGLPYFVMEYVEGKPITEYCDAHRLPMRARLKLFKTVCDAVRHAQRNQVVHRDLKPSNILVTAEGEVKLLDFGIAKLLAKDGESEDLYTATGARGPFTPAYASPEQVNGQPVDTSTDVYALGVILYELLTGRRPYELDRSGLTPDNMRLICEHIPTIPSSVVTRRFLNERSEVPGALSKKRASEPLKLRRLLRGDVDAIVMKALKKEPERRYPSAAELWSDLNYYLLNRPISARHDSSRYRAFKFVQRHKWSVAAFTFAAFAVFGGLFSSISQASIAKEERDEKIKEANRANVAWEYLDEILLAIDPDVLQGKEISAFDLLKTGVDNINQLDDQPDVKASILKTIGTAYLNLGKFQDADSILSVAGDLYIGKMQSEAIDVVDALFKLGQAKRNTSEYDLAINLFEQALALLENATSQEGVLLESQINSELSLVYSGLRKFEEALRYAQKANTIASELVRDSSANRLDLNMALSLDRMATAYKGLESFLLSDSLYSSALSIRRRILGNKHPKVANTLVGMTSVLFYLERWEDAIMTTEEARKINLTAYGDDHVSVALCDYWLGRIRSREEKYKEANFYFQRARAKYLTAVGKNHPWTIVADAYFGISLLELQEVSRAIEILEKVRVRYSENGIGDSDRRVVINNHYLGRAYLQKNQFEEAGELLLMNNRLLQDEGSAWAKDLLEENRSLLARI
ncbi:MAG: serine/threonine-protein kinase [Bacteroidota bacterium]